jgi:hypothetical protein
MAFTSLADRIQALPLLLCGPILRKVEPETVTVWVALKTEKKVWLEVYENISATSTPDLKKLLEGDRKTIRLGDHLHIVAVTAKLISGQTKMSSGKLYYYNLFLTDPGAASHSPGDTNLEPPGLTPYEIHYAHEPEELGPHSEHIHLPSFCLAPEDLNHLRIVHGSCRKTHAEGLDALPGIDAMILSDRFTPDKRPHYLFLTGDQFYADDVSPILLYLLMDAEEALLGIVEYLPVIKKPTLSRNGNAGNLLPWQREILEDKGGYTSREKNHIATAGEYISLYLLGWSDIFWDDEFPAFEDVYSAEKENSPAYNLQGYKQDLDSLTKFRDGLAKVRRAMANIPTYMIFDDHDVTDDWYMTFDWCKNTLSTKLGRRLILNGLLSYSLFQAWGNTPELFFETDDLGNVPNGKLLLDAAEEWFSSGSERENDAEIETVGANEITLQKYLGIPLIRDSEIVNIRNDIKGVISDNIKEDIFRHILPPDDYYVLKQDNDALKWNFQITKDQYEIIFLDGRTRRGYPNPETGPRKEKSHADIISDESLADQLSVPPNHQPKAITILVSPTSVVGIPAIELNEFPLLVREIAISKFEKDIYEFDIFDHWRNQSKETEKLLTVLSTRNLPATTPPSGIKNSRTIILTGDVHFAAASRIQYENAGYKSLFAQLISSSFKKQEIKTRLLHQMGYKFGNISAIVVGDLFLGMLGEKLIKKFDGVDNPFLRLALLLPLGVLFAVLILLHVGFYFLDRILQILDQTILKDWFNEKGAEPRHFLGWADPKAKENIDHLRIPIDTTSTPVKFEEIKFDKPYVVNNNVLKDAAEPKLKFPDWQYRIDFINAANDVRGPAPDPSIPPLTAPSPGDRKVALAQYLALAKNHMQYAKKSGNGKEIVGLNNISEVFFEWGDTEKFVRQETWWRLEGNDGEMLTLFPLSKFKVSLNFDDPEFPIPALPIPPN